MYPRLRRIRYAAHIAAVKSLARPEPQSPDRDRNPSRVEAGDIRAAGVQIAEIGQAWAD